MKQITNIKWDTDGDKIAGLPDHMIIPQHIDDDDIADYLSNRFGFCVFSYAVEAVDSFDDIDDETLIDVLMRRIGNGNVLGVKAWVAADINLSLPETAKPYGKRDLKRIAKEIDDEPLTDCMDAEWDALREAVSTACATLGIEDRTK